MQRIDRYEDLAAWQFASELADLVDTLVETGGAARNQSFHDQILKSSSKAPAQIAEGFLRYRPKESAYYYRIARASLGETQNHLRRGYHRKYWEEADFNKAMELAKGAMDTTGGLLASKLAQIRREAKEEKERKRKRKGPGPLPDGEAKRAPLPDSERSEPPLPDSERSEPPLPDSERSEPPCPTSVSTKRAGRHHSTVPLCD